MKRILRMIALTTGLIVGMEAAGNAQWRLNNFLLLMYLCDQAKYTMLRANGVQWFNCFESDENGAYPSTACQEAPPPDLAE